MRQRNAGWVAILVSLVALLHLSTFTRRRSSKTTLVVQPKRASTPEEDESGLRECRPRGGWAHFFSKMENDPPFSRRKIAFIGGSITAKEDCWRPQTMALFRRLYPKVEWHEINAAVRGTASDAGVFRLERDVLAHDPDLIFIEFLCNNGKLSKTEVRRSMEGIVRKIRHQSPFTDIAFVYVVTDYMAPYYDLGNGTLPYFLDEYEALAEHYGIPTIHLGMEILKQAQAENVTWSWGVKGSQERFEEAKTFVFASDGVHPHAFTGCVEYTKAIERAVPLIQRQSPVPDNVKYVGLPPAMEVLNYENATWTSPQKAELQGIQQKNTLDFLDFEYQHNVYLAQHPDDRITVKFTGSFVGIYAVVGPFSGDLLLQLDWGVRERYVLFSTFTYYPRLAYFVLYKDLPETTHSLVIDVTSTLLGKDKIMASRNRTIPSKFLNQTGVGIIAFCTLSFPSLQKTARSDTLAYPKKIKG